MDVEKLIACVFFRPPVWNQANADHHNWYVTLKLMADIPSEMNTSSKSF